MQYQKEDIRQRILLAGIDEFLTEGYRGGKISNIAKTANVPIGNLYRYFDGKNGLLDAIVKDTYNLIPRYVAEIVSVSDDPRSKDLTELAAALTRVILDLLSRCKKQILILVDKCEGSKYADFKLKLYDLVNKYINDMIFKSQTKEDEVFCSVISKSFLNMIFDILNKGDVESYGNLIYRLLLFCFYDVEKRI